MAYELWATYSVQDHFEPRRFATDLMLFDRLVFPVPEQGSIPPASGSPVDIGPVEWVRDEVEWARWEHNKWEPEAQQQLLDCLGPTVRKVSWSGAGPVQERYRAEWATGPLDQPAHLPGNLLAVVLGAEFLTPDPEDDLSTEHLLRETAEFVAGDEKFRSSRAAFHEWQRKFLNPSGTTDSASIKRAVEKMHELVTDANAAAGQLKIRKTVRNVFRLAPIGLGLAGAFAGGGPVFAMGGAFISLGSFAIDEKLFKSAEQGQPPPAAFVRDARRHFGWKN